MSRLEGSRWRLRRAREMRLAMEFEWVFFRLFFGAKPECRHFHARGEESQIPPHTSRIISRAASAAPAASFLPTIRTSGDSTCLLCLPGLRTLKRPPFQTLDGVHYPSKMLSTRLAQQSEISSTVTAMLSSTHEATSEATAAAADCAR